VPCLVQPSVLMLPSECRLQELMEDGDSIFHDMTADKAKAKEMLK